MLVISRYGYQVGTRRAIKKNNYKTAVYNMFLLMDMRQNLMLVPVSAQAIHNIDPRHSDIRIWGILRSIEASDSGHEDRLSSLDAASREKAQRKIAEARRIAGTVEAVSLPENISDLQ